MRVTARALRSPRAEEGGALKIQFIFFFFILIISACFLPACTSVATSVAASGASAVYSHQSLQKSASDQLITMRAYQAIDIDSDHFKDSNINVSTLNHFVLLTGQTPTSDQKEEAQEIVEKLEGVQHVYNWLTVRKPVPQRIRLSDTWLTTKIKTKLIASSELDVTRVKVVTEEGIVFLMGFVRPHEADAAVKVASTTNGVQQVVKLFFYLNLSKTPLDDNVSLEG